jgi:phytoene synthase
MSGAIETIDAVDTCRAILAHKSRSFRLAAQLLPAACRDDAAVVYAWCRRADDAVDERPRPEQAAAVAALRAELDLIYAASGTGVVIVDPIVGAFADVVRRRHIPRFYADEHIEGKAMDQRDERYAAMADLYRYCFRVAGTVGLMMCHVMGVEDPAARVHAAHLGMGMQLTNICRDVAEDWGRGRLYLPETLLADVGALAQVNAEAARAGAPLPEAARKLLAPVVRTLLADAERFYRSGERGLGALGWRCALAVDAARRVYGGIGDEVARRGHDVFAGRAVVSWPRKLWLLGGCLGRALRRAFTGWRAHPAEERVPRRAAAAAPATLATMGWSDDFLRP